MVVGEAINNIMGGIENTGTVRLNNHKRKLKQRFDIIKKLGQGTYGKVQLGINKETGQEVAIKTIKKSKIETEADLIRIRREIQIMSSVQHPNIIHIYEVFENKEKMVLVMEYAAGGELYDYLYEKKMLVEEEARRIFRQISTACYYCHKHKICHRDLKLENILLDENKNAKIADFGLSNVFEDQRQLSTFCGSPLYASPEIVNGTPYQGPEVDCWSLGVLLYTLVYGAMPFDGSNFKRLVRQISQGDYFEPKKPSPASPLIMEMLTVNPKNRANIEKICAHWWVNEGYSDSCLDISEELANQTPVRLDVLLSLNPPPAQIESEKLVVTGEEVPGEEEMKAEPVVPTRSQSVGSLMEISTPEKRIKEMIAQDVKTTPKRKLETTVSTDRANVANEGGRRKEKIVKENTVADISVETNKSKEDVKMVELEQQGAACAEIVEEAKKKAAMKRTMSTTLSPKILEEINENPSQENLYEEKGEDMKNKEEEEEEEKKKVKSTVVEVKDKDKENDVKTEEVKAPVKKKIVKKKVLTDKNESSPEKKVVAEVEEKKKVESDVKEESPTKPVVERRQSRIFEQAEKFQNLISSSDSKSQVPEKPKKLIIPGVSVGGFKKEFERKASLTSTSPPKLKPVGVVSKKLIIEDSKPQQQEEIEVEVKAETEEPQVEVKEQTEKLRNAVSIISNALDKEGARKSKSRPCMTRKPPVPFGASGRSASGSIGMVATAPDIKRYIKVPTTVQSSQPQQAKTQPEPAEPPSQTSSAEITLKSATLPRRKSAKAEIKLDYPQPRPATMEFKTEMAHKIQGATHPTLTSQRSEVTFPVNSPPPIVGFRSASMEPEGSRSLKERIIPIAFAQHHQHQEMQSPPTKPPVPRLLQTQKSATSQRSSSLSRQSTQESDNEAASSGDPIKKSPREYIIPIAVEGGGYVTPRAGSLEPSETSSTVTNSSRKTTSTSKLGRPRRMTSLFDRDGSEDESPFGTLHRHSSFGRQDSDTEGDSRKDSFPMHRLRSSRPRKSNLEHNDSLSSGEDDDDEDGFEFLTAENLFSTLLSRVRDLTQRINVDDRPGFPNSRLLSHFDHGTHFWNRRDPLTTARNSTLGRQFSRERSLNSSTSIPWRRSVSRDLASDIDSVFNDRTPSRTSSLPRGVDDSWFKFIDI